MGCAVALFFLGDESELLLPMEAFFDGGFLIPFDLAETLLFLLSALVY